ncbi:MAG: choice-of-anchor L domain-containing protein, partial [Bacteroidetes bacterium]|nr:choice-of-anchor L domain-containing protein [Bacteroidota bacterium]
MKRSILIHFIILLGCCNFIFSQQITIDNSLSAQQLIENHLVEGCVEVTNITSTVNGSVNGFSSFGSFDRASSNFPLENGIVLATGNATSGGNTFNDQDLNEGTVNWGTDPDYETALGTSNTHNATSIEFDFISVSNLIQFDYLIASEEYGSQYLCDYADSFVFLIRETASAGPYTNVALVPGTSTPVSTNSIHAEIFGFCPPQNEAYFDNYDIGDTNYNGRTIVLSAGTTITPYVQYHVKLVIADGFDQNFDSAVFIQGNSLTPVINLGDNLTTCADTIVLDADIENSFATYDWYLNNALVVNDGSPIFNVTQSGIYRVEVSVPLNGEVCIIEDEIEINISTEQTADPIADYLLCDSNGNGFEIFDLSTKDAEVLASVPPANYAFTYHLSLSDAENNVNPILSPIQNTGNPQTIHVRIQDIDAGCLTYGTINLVVSPLPAIINPMPFSLCDDVIADGFTSFDLTQIDNSIISGQADLVVTYHLTQADANNGVNALTSPYTNINTPTEQLFVRVTNAQTGCISTTTVQIQVVDNPIVNPDRVYIDACDLDHNGFDTFDLTQAISEILQGLTNVTVTFHVTQADAESGSNPIANSTNYENIDIDEQIIYVRVEDNTTGCASIKELEIHTNLLLTGTNIQDFALCDDEGNGSVDFNLGSIAFVIVNYIPGINITFYETQTDLNNGINPLDPLVAYTVNNFPRTLYIELTNGSCTEQAEFDLLINA